MPPQLIVKKKTATNTSKLKTDSIDADRSTTTGTECILCTLSFSFLSGSTTIPIITLCGHTKMCETCFNTANQTAINNNRLPSCPICRVVQFGLPLRVKPLNGDLHTRLKFTLKIEYNGHVTDSDLVLQIQCFMSITGKEIRDLANEILVQKNIYFPNDCRTVYFETSKKRIALHANTTLQDVGFDIKTDTLSIHEGFIELTSKIVQAKLLKLPRSPDVTFRLTIYSNSGSQTLKNLTFNATKTDSFFKIARHVFTYVFQDCDNQMRQILLQIGVVLLMPEMGFKYVLRTETVKQEHPLTLGDLKVSGATNHMYYCLGQ